MKCECRRELLINKTVDYGKVQIIGAHFMAEVGFDLELRHLNSGTSC